MTYRVVVQCEGRTQEAKRTTDRIDAESYREHLCSLRLPARVQVNIDGHWFDAETEQ